MWIFVTLWDYKVLLFSDNNKYYKSISLNPLSFLGSFCNGLWIFMILSIFHSQSKPTPFPSPSVTSRVLSDVGHMFPKTVSNCLYNDVTRVQVSGVSKTLKIHHTTKLLSKHWFSTQSYYNNIEGVRSIFAEVILLISVANAIK